ncbi:MAG: penicillin-binding transpeptidase domain-containing protein, partial [Thermoflexales bacterium]|nr:penicillin-binding transpeptidase domain-containing protein [Thermoflexales bacterium]
LDLTLTLSPTLQRRVQQLLGARAGAVVVMHPADGAVLAMASVPAFVIGEMHAADVRGGALLNRASQGQYPPGSTFKIVTLAAALEEGIAQPETRFFDPGYWEGFGSRFRQWCWLRSGHGRISLRDGLAASCNVVFYELGRQLNARAEDALSRYARAFGFGQPTGVELEEEAGLVPDPTWKQRALGERWVGGDAVNLAIGQGALLATPLQVARMTAAVANGGMLVRPRLVSAAPPERVPLPLRPETLRAIQDAMLGVTTSPRYGTAFAAFRGFDYCERQQQWVRCAELPAHQRATLRRLRVAGKTGTAQASLGRKPFAWFTGYAPADDPQVVVTVLLENAGEGSAEAAPLARAVLEAYFGAEGGR